MTRTDLASYLGMTLECLSRVLARLGRAGIIDAGRSAVTVIDAAALRALARRGDADSAAPFDPGEQGRRV